ncbi:zinc finger protein 883-like [Sitophilus oryzae]|uniref:Zinc finger protein 883-like n=1 Tax=Sitophilus oryzae TaxID=7048 RepID=A0A6J2X8X4_SITOR|nr:zinc finger protein 883-like [Sitophilus oryzae]
MEIHTDVAKHECEICHKKFKVEYYLRIHKLLNHKKEVLGIEETFQCEICGRKFTFEKSFKRHLSCIHKVGKDMSVECSVCKKVISNRQTLKKHMRTHTSEKAFSCETCGKGFSLNTYLIRHQKVHLRENGFKRKNASKKEGTTTKKVRKSTREPKLRIKREKKEVSQKLTRNQKANMWTCKFCLDTFGSRKDMFKHRKEHIADAKGKQRGTECQDLEEIEKHVETHEEKFNCYVCKEDLFGPINYSVHVQKHRDDKLYPCPWCQYVSQKKGSYKAYREKPYSCVYCSKSFIKRDYLIMHERIHSGEKPYSCEICGKCFNQGAPLRIHIRSHTGERPYICPYCGSGCVSRGALNSHIKSCVNTTQTLLSFKEHEIVHLNIKPFECVVYSKHFYYSRYLFSHQTRTHTVRVYDPESKTQCNVCQKIFARLDTLEKHYSSKHLNVRTGPYEKKHLCDVCGQGFSRPDKLKIHYRKHTGEKPYSCVYCSKSFIKRDYLIMHERIHSGEKPYSCEICGKCFNQGAPLRIHIRSHTGERPYICPYCGSGCVSRGALNSHIKSCVNTTQT